MSGGSRVLPIGILLILITSCAGDRVRLSSVDYQYSRLTVRTNPPGAEAYQVPLGGESNKKVLLGTTPLENIPVLALNSFKLTSKRLTEEMLVEMTDLASKSGRAFLLIEKEGYEPYYANLEVGKEEPVVHEIMLTPK